MRLLVLLSLSLSFLGFPFGGSASEIPMPRSYVFFQPNFEDQSCIEGLAGLYLADDQQARTLFAVPDTNGIRIREFMKSSTTTAQGGTHYWLDETPVARFDLGEVSEVSGERFTTHDTFCDGPARLVILTIEHDFGDQEKTEETLGRPSTRVVYLVYETLNIGKSTFLRDEVGWETIYHTDRSPYYVGRGRGDQLDEGKLKEALEERVATYANLRRSGSKPSRGRLDLVPTNEPSAPFIVSFEKVVPAFSIATYGAAFHLRRLLKRNATSEDFEERKAKAESLIFELNRGN